MSSRTPQFPQRPKHPCRRGYGKGISLLSAKLSSETDDCIEWPFYRMKNG